jgi:hypothetical protein
MTKNKYPEHEKLLTINSQSEIIGQFLDWQKLKDRELCQFNSDYDDFMPVLHGSIKKV